MLAKLVKGLGELFVLSLKVLKNEFEVIAKSIMGVVSYTWKMRNY